MCTIPNTTNAGPIWVELCNGNGAPQYEGSMTGAAESEHMKLLSNNSDLVFIMSGGVVDSPVHIMLCKGTATPTFTKSMTSNEVPFNALLVREVGISRILRSEERKQNTMLGAHIRATSRCFVQTEHSN